MALKKYHVSLNLFDPNLTRYHLGLSNAQAKYIGGSPNGAMFYIKAQPNTEYHVKVYTTDATFVRLYVSNNILQTGAGNIQYEEMHESETMINPEISIANVNNTYLWIQVGGTWYTNHGGTSIMLNKGNTALPLEPFETDNLFNEIYPNIDSSLHYLAIYVGDGQFTMSTTCPRNQSGACLFFLAGDVSSGASTESNGVWGYSGTSYGTMTRTQTAVNGYVTIAYRSLTTELNPVNEDTMVNSGSTAKPYTPYGSVWNDIQYRRYETATDAVTNLPVEIFTDGQPVSSYTLKGNTSVSGTPSPSNPVTIQGVGEETANLLNRDTGVNGYLDNEGNFITPHANLYASDYIVIPAGAEYVTQSFDSTSGMVSPAMCFYDSTKTFISGEAFSGELTKTFTVPNNAYFLRTCYRSTFPWVMLNVGNTALPYEPYGFKISILKDLSPLTPMYFSQQLMLIGDTTDDYSSSGTATYRIAKYEITGNEQWRDTDTPIENTYCYRFTPTGIINVGQSIPIDSVCTHFQCGAYYNSNEIGYQHTNDRLYFRVTQSTVESFKQWLADLYAAGTPVTVWYILETPTTETVTAPTITTTGGTATIDVDTTVKPSELDLTYHGWHEHEPLKRENGQWV